MLDLRSQVDKDVKRNDDVHQIIDKEGEDELAQTGDN